MGNEIKKGFWATLFSRKPACGCGCSQSVAETDKSALSYASAGKPHEVIVLGPGCSKCKATYKLVENVIQSNNLEVKLSKVEDIVEIMNYNILSTPAVVVDGVVRIKGHVPTESEVKSLLGI